MYKSLRMSLNYVTIDVRSEEWQRLLCCIYTVRNDSRFLFIAAIYSQLYTMSFNFDLIGQIEFETTES